jgi:transmembrane sensor
MRPLFLEAGQSITIPASKETSLVVNKSERDLQRELSWQEGLHDFSETPLENVIREVSRYSPLEVEITDPALREIRFGGIFRTGETQPLLDALQASYGVNVEYVGDTKVRLSLVGHDVGKSGREEQDN